MPETLNNKEWWLTSWRVWTIGLMLFLFPAFSSTIQHSSGLLFYILVFGGIFFARNIIQDLSWEERTLFFGLLIFFLISIFSLSYATDVDHGTKRLERYLHLPLAFFAYLFLKKYRVISETSFLYSLYAGAGFLFSVAIYKTVILNHARATLDHYPIIFGDAAILISLLLVAYIVTRVKHSPTLILPGLFSLLALYAAFASGTRGALFVIPFALIFFWIIYRHKFSTRKILIGLGVGFVIFTAVASMMKSSPAERVAMIGHEITRFLSDDEKGHQSSTGARLSMWHDAVLMWKSAPMLGSGLGDFMVDSEQYIKDGISRPRKLYGHAHNIYLDTLANTGLIGLVILVFALFVFPFYLFFKHFNKVGGEDEFIPLAGMLFILSFAVFGLTEGWLARNVFVRMYILYFVILFAFSMVLTANKAK